jgi:hypothetical protein
MGRDSLQGPLLTHNICTLSEPGRVAMPQRNIKPRSLVRSEIAHASDRAAAM